MVCYSVVSMLDINMENLISRRNLKTDLFAQETEMSVLPLN